METCEKSVRNEVQNDVTGEEKGVTRVTVDRIHGERLMFRGGGGGFLGFVPREGGGAGAERGRV